MGAIAVHHTATEDSPWDANAAVSAMPADAATLRYCHAWVDSEGDPDLKGSYKFPHHRREGGPANLAACRNGLARLSQADIPEGDRAAVEAHLRAHLDDAQQNDHTESLTDRLRIARPVAKLRQGRADWYSITNRADGAAEVMVYDEIGYFGVTAKDFVRDLANIQSDQIDVHLNTPGGEVFDGIAIYNALKNHRANVTTIVDGLAASIGSVIAMAGDRIVMAKNAQMMIHDGHAMSVGNAADMRTMADLLDKTSDNIASIYAERTGQTAASFRKLMRNETWYTAQEAVKAGLADEIQGTNKTPDNSWDLSLFNYSGRGAAPAPENTNTPEFVFDPEVFRAAMKGAF